MPTFKAPVKDYSFLLNEVYSIGNLHNLRGFNEMTPEFVTEILGQVGKLAEEVIQPLNKVADEQHCRLEDGKMVLPDGYEDAYAQYTEAGWQAMAFPEEFGGMDMPYTLTLATSEMTSAACMAFMMFPGLTNGASEAIIHWGTDEQKQTYLPKMISGEWCGTMNLTEPHCGTDLGLLKTKAEPQEDGSYKITGTKIFISSGDHEMTDNIIHLVLARMPDAPAGVKGISLFIVPKYIVNEDGSLQPNRNNLGASRIEEKMGLHGNPTCVMNYEGSTGYLIGNAHQGLRAMFTMMNEARLGVGVQGLSQSEVAYQNGAAYALDRLQGRGLKGVEHKDKVADPLIVHPDIRRMLMQARAFNEGARALAVETGLAADMKNRSEDKETKAEAEDFLALMTPIIKAYMSDMAYENATNCQQILGGHGYVTEWGMDQFVRDARITQIYEGANGIQALDLIGRKLPTRMGSLLRTFFHPASDFIQDNISNPKIGKAFVMPLAKALTRLQEATGYIAQAGMKNPNDAAAGSVEYLRLFALVALGYQWAKMAKVAAEKLEAGEGDLKFYENKIKTGRFFMDKMLPDTASLKVKVMTGSESTMALDEDDFVAA